MRNLPRSPSQSEASTRTLRVGKSLADLLDDLKDRHNLRSYADASDTLMTDILNQLGQAEDFLHPIRHEVRGLIRDMEDQGLDDYANLMATFNSFFNATRTATERRPVAVQHARDALVAGIKYAKGEVDHPLEYHEGPDDEL